MKLNDFSEKTKTAYSSGAGFLLWEVNGEPADNMLECGEHNMISHVMVCQGEMEIEAGRERHLLGKGEFGNFIDKPTFRILRASRNLYAFVMIVSGKYARELMNNNPPFPYSYIIERRRQPVTTLPTEASSLVQHRMTIIREVCTAATHSFREEMIALAVRMLLFDIAELYIKQSGEGQGWLKSERKNEIFRQFMHLLPVHVMKEHSVGFYASELCVSPQYLNYIVKASSFKTVSEWITFHLVGEISKRLENTSCSMQQIAADLRFPTQAALTKFFKRATGCSPSEYRKKKTQEGRRRPTLMK